MTITVPTGEFVGLLQDVIPFAFPKDDLPDINVVRLHWDGYALTAAATDTMRLVRSTWHPHDEAGETLTSPYGGADEPWGLLIRLEDAKAMVNHFKVPTKLAAAPLTLDHNRGKLTVARDEAAGLEAVQVDVVGRLADYPNVDQVLDAPVRTQPVERLAYAGRHLADFGSVRQRGALILHFDGTGNTRITIGSRFTGTIRPDRNALEEMDQLGAGELVF